VVSRPLLKTIFTLAKTMSSRESGRKRRRNGCRCEVLSALLPLPLPLPSVLPFSSRCVFFGVDELEGAFRFSSSSSTEYSVP
jgi:hypothetical protein